ETEKETNASRSGALGKALAQIFLPPVGFGKSPGGGTKPISNSNADRLKNNGKLHIEKYEFGKDNTLILNFYIKIQKKTSYIDIDVQVESEGAKKFKGNDWEKETEIGVPFPVEIIGFSFEEYIECEHIIIKTDRFQRNSKVR